MKLFLIFLGTIAVLGIQACGSAKKTTGADASPYASRKLTATVDGNSTEWGNDFSYDKETKTIYSIANDADHLYILIKSADRMQQAKILQGGIEIWLDDKAKKNKTVGIKFPLGNAMNMQALPSNRSGSERPSQPRQQPGQQFTTMELVGFKDGLNGQQSVQASSPIKPAIQYDESLNLIYELAVPFSALPEDFLEDFSSLSIGVIIKGLKLPEGGGMPGGAPGGPGGGMRRPSAPPPGGGSMPDRSGMENMSKDGVFWIKYSFMK